MSGKTFKEKKCEKYLQSLKKMYPTGLGFTCVSINELTNKAINNKTSLQRTIYHWSAKIHLKHKNKILTFNKSTICFQYWFSNLFKKCTRE